MKNNPKGPRPAERNSSLPWTITRPNGTIAPRTHDLVVDFDFECRMAKNSSERLLSRIQDLLSRPSLLVHPVVVKILLSRVSRDLWESIFPEVKKAYSRVEFEVRLVLPRIAPVKNTPISLSRAEAARAVRTLTNLDIHS